MEEHKVPLLMERIADGHKGEFGRIFALAGSKGMVGAALLCAEAMLRGGAGYVKLGMPWRLTAIAAANPYTTCVLTADLPETEDGSISMMAQRKIIDECKGYDVMAIGPGLSRHKQTMNLVLSLIVDPEFEAALVLDADGLQALAGEGKKAIPNIRREKGLPIFTPHPGEFRVLTGLPKAPIDPHVRLQQCREYASKNEVVCVLKGFRTVVSDGERVYVNDHDGLGNGNNGMASAGSGDVLTGLISALRGQGYDSYEAAVLGVYLHALAGDLAEARLGPWSMTAHDILTHVPRAFLHHWRASIGAREAAAAAGLEAPKFMDPVLEPNIIEGSPSASMKKRAVKATKG